MGEDPEHAVVAAAARPQGGARPLGQDLRDRGAAQGRVNAQPPAVAEGRLVLPQHVRKENVCDGRRGRVVGVPAPDREQCVADVVLERRVAEEAHRARRGVLARRVLVGRRERQARATARDGRDVVRFRLRAPERLQREQRRLVARHDEVRPRHRVDRVLRRRREERRLRRGRDARRSALHARVAQALADRAQDVSRVEHALRERLQPFELAVPRRDPAVVRGQRSGRRGAEHPRLHEQHARVELVDAKPVREARGLAVPATAEGDDAADEILLRDRDVRCGEVRAVRRRVAAAALRPVRELAVTRIARLGLERLLGVQRDVDVVHVLGRRGLDANLDRHDIPDPRRVVVVAVDVRRRRVGEEWPQVRHRDRVDGRLVGDVSDLDTEAERLGERHAVRLERSTVRERDERLCLRARASRRRVLDVPRDQVGNEARANTRDRRAARRAIRQRDRLVLRVERLGRHERHLARKAHRARREVVPELAREHAVAREVERHSLAFARKEQRSLVADLGRSDAERRHVAVAQAAHHEFADGCALRVVERPDRLPQAHVWVREVVELDRVLEVRLPARVEQVVAGLVLDRLRGDGELAVDKVALVPAEALDEDRRRGPGREVRSRRAVRDREPRVAARLRVHERVHDAALHRPSGEVVGHDKAVSVERLGVVDRARAVARTLPLSRARPPRARAAVRVVRREPQRRRARAVLDRHERIARRVLAGQRVRADAVQVRSRDSRAVYDAEAAVAQRSGVHSQWDEAARPPRVEALAHADEVRVARGVPDAVAREVARAVGRPADDLHAAEGRGAVGVRVDVGDRVVLRHEHLEVPVRVPARVRASASGGARRARVHLELHRDVVLRAGAQPLVDEDRAVALRAESTRSARRRVLPARQVVLHHRGRVMAPLGDVEPQEHERVVRRAVGVRRRDADALAHVDRCERPRHRRAVAALLREDDALVERFVEAVRRVEAHGLRADCGSVRAARLGLVELLLDRDLERATELERTPTADVERLRAEQVVALRHEAPADVEVFDVREVQVADERDRARSARRAAKGRRSREERRVRLVDARPDARRRDDLVVPLERARGGSHRVGVELDVERPRADVLVEADLARVVVDAALERLLLEVPVVGHSALQDVVDDVDGAVATSCDDTEAAADRHVELVGSDGGRIHRSREVLGARVRLKLDG